VDVSKNDFEIPAFIKVEFLEQLQFPYLIRYEVIKFAGPLPITL
jgi:hypothetical protein